MQLKLLAKSDNHAHLAITGDISDLYVVSGDLFEAALGHDPYVNNVLLNLENAAKIDSSGLGWLITNYKRFAEKNGRMILHSIPPLIYQIIKLVKLEKIIECAADYDAARQRLLSPPTE